MKQKNYPIYKTTFIDDMRSLVEEAAQNFSDKIFVVQKRSGFQMVFLWPVVQRTVTERAHISLFNF